MNTYYAQHWQDQELVSEVGYTMPLSIDAAREIARTAPMLGFTGRVCPHETSNDYWEVYTADGNVRTGRFDQVTLVWVTE